MLKTKQLATQPLINISVVNKYKHLNLSLILGLTFGSIILIGVGSYLGYWYYKKHKNKNIKI
ncbi:hypothetical protein MGM1_0160 [Candidatus Malacoplasma girerdii]|uniref:Uncharacterized protein n=1 Tax=Candidatus Malacoplasma girerdii TaxID=1318617 RepID=A0A097SS28_9BACT|nr:hypothetical protein MGM1_0160 [Candidatus Malacoplasma girerdii]